jgi:hypothetical protein
MLPPGVSLLEVKLEEKENKVTAPAAAGKATAGAKPAKPTQYQAAAAGKQAKQAPAEARTVLQNDLVIEGIAHSDIEVASYIANLSGTTLLDNVQLIESKEQKIEDITYRQFRLRTSLKYNVTLTKDDINTIRKQREETI